MRVLIGADTYAPDVNGACQFARRLAAGLAGRGHDVHVVAPARGWYSRTTTVGALTEHRVRSMPVPRPAGFRICPPPGLTPLMRPLLLRVRPDVVHVQSHILLGRALLDAAGGLALPTVATTHMIPDNLLPALPIRPLPNAALSRLFWWDAARVLSRAAVVTAPTPYAAGLAERHGVPGPVRAVSNGTDLSRFRSDSGGRGAAFRRRYGLHDGPVVGVVGRLDREKHVDEVIRAFGLVRPAGQLLVVGDGSVRNRLIEAARVAGVAGSVRFTGWIDDEEVPDAFAALDVFVNAGTAELQSLVTLEAMATGLPVVAVAAGALPHLVRPGTNGLLYRHGDHAGLARALTTLLDDPALRHGMGAAGRRIAREHTLGATLDAFETIYQDLCRSAPPARARTEVA